MKDKLFCLFIIIFFPFLCIWMKITDIYDTWKDGRELQKNETSHAEDFIDSL